MTIWSDGVSRSVARCALRCLVWFLTVAGAIFAPLFAADANFSFFISDWATDAAAKGLFPDLYFVVIVMALFALGNISYNVLTSDSRVNVWAAVIMLALLVFYIVLLASGTNRFDHLINLTQSGQLTIAMIGRDINLIKLTLAIGLLTEITIGLRELPPFPAGPSLALER